MRGPCSDAYVSLDQFLSQTSFIVHGVKISRRTAIKYVANKLGGAHYDEKKKNSFKPIGYQKKKKRSSLYLTLYNPMQVMDRNPIYYEMIGIGQKVVHSKNTDKLIRSIKSLQRMVLTRRDDQRR